MRNKRRDPDAPSVLPMGEVSVDKGYYSTGQICDLHQSHFQHKTHLIIQHLRRYFRSFKCVFSLKVIFSLNLLISML